MNGHTKTQFTASPVLEEKLRLRKALLDITNRIHAAQNIKQILVDLKDGILNLFSAHSLTIYVVDSIRNEIYSLFLAGTQLKEIRVPISNQSIAGYVATTGRVVNIADAYNKEELKTIDADLSFDQSWDNKSGFRTRQILAAPVWYNNQLLGVIQILNKKAVEGHFTQEEIGLALEIAEVLGVALYNQQRFERRRKTRFDYLINHDLIKEEDLDKAWEEAREQRDSLENCLMRKYKISKDDIGCALEDFYHCRFIQYSDKTAIPGDLIKNLKRDFLRRELWVPLGKIDGNIHVVVDDPNNILKREHFISEDFLICD